MTSPKTYICAGLALAAAAGLVSCNRGADARLPLVGKSYCSPFRTATTTSNTSNPNGQSGLTGSATQPATDPGAALDDCVHRWAYALAPSRDPADIVAHGAIDACSAMVTALSQQAGSAPTESSGPPQERQQQQQAESPVAQQMRATEGKALFYVVQARAAGCAPPPANTLPAG